jgi:enoyl-CoA hydratase/carnithine racemase
MAGYKYCRVTDEGSVRIVTLNRPEVMNALRSDAHDELESAWDEFPTLRLRGVVLAKPLLAILLRAAPRL